MFLRRAVATGSSSFAELLDPIATAPGSDTSFDTLSSTPGRINETFASLRDGRKEFESIAKLSRRYATRTTYHALPGVETPG